jgi:hypothetical protein
MPTAEPLRTPLIITTFGTLIAASVIFGRGSQRFGVPVGTD